MTSFLYAYLENMSTPMLILFIITTCVLMFLSYARSENEIDMDDWISFMRYTLPIWVISLFGLFLPSKEHIMKVSVWMNTPAVEQVGVNTVDEGTTPALIQHEVGDGMMCEPITGIIQLVNKEKK